jgi:hypothetical protein
MSGVPEIETNYSENYKRVNVGGVFGGISPGGVEAIVYSESRRAEKVLETEPISPNRIRVRRTIEIELLIDPFQMRAIHQWLGNKIQEYERIFGRIPSPEEVESRTRRNPQQ